MNYIDLFAGAGGLSEGFNQVGFEPVAHIEMNIDAADTLKTRACYYYLRRHNQLDLYYRYERREITRQELYDSVPNEELERVLNCEISPRSIRNIFVKVDELLQGNLDWNNQVDVIIGGPPCQAYSLIGRSVITEDKKKKDTRPFLYRLYCQFLRRYQPRMFVFENVPGLLTADGGQHFANLQRYLHRVGYTIDWRELNAKDFGVLQSRRRIVIIGWRNGEEHHYPEFEPIVHNYQVKAILQDLPVMQAGESRTSYRRVVPSEYLTEFGIREERDVLTFHTARPHLERDKKIYRKVIDAWNDGHRRLKYSDLPDELRTHKNVTAFLDRFKVVEGDTPYCHTMMAHISKDGHYFIHPDKKQARSITVREAARIQSFPDNYFFEGSRTAAFTQIGNAVPPLMSRAIAQALLQQLQ